MIGWLDRCVQPCSVSGGSPDTQVDYKIQKPRPPHALNMTGALCIQTQSQSETESERESDTESESDTCILLFLPVL